MKNKILMLSLLISVTGCASTSKRTNFVEGGWVAKVLSKGSYYISYEGDFFTSNSLAETRALDQARTTCLKSGASGDFKVISSNISTTNLQIGYFGANKPTASYIIECESAQRLNNLVNYKFNTPRSVVAYPDSSAGTVNRQRFNEAWEKYLKNNSKE